MKGIFLKPARMSRGYIRPVYRSYARALMNFLAGPYLRGGENLTGVSLSAPEPFCRALKDHQEGKIRLILLFRHSDKADAPAVMYSVNKLAPKEGRRLGISFRKGPHACFLYGKDVPNWAGALAAWIFPRLGNIPVINRGVCQESMADIRRALNESPFPLALAPEGQVTYHGGRCFDLEPGVTHMARWAGENGTPVRLLPLAPVYDYGRKKEQVLARTCQRWMKITGLSLNSETGSLIDGPREDGPRELLLEMTDKTLALLEGCFLPHAIPDGKDRQNPDDRIAALNDAILSEGEILLGLEGRGKLIDRIFRIRYRGVETWYPETRDPADDTPWEKSESDWACVKTAAAVRCSQIADVLEYIHTGYLPRGEIHNRHCEYALNLLDVVNRFRGGDIGTRFCPGKRKVLLAVGEAIDPAEYRSSSSRRERHEKLLSAIKASLDKLSLEAEELRDKG